MNTYSKKFWITSAGIFAVLSILLFIIDMTIGNAGDEATKQALDKAEQAINNSQNIPMIPLSPIILAGSIISNVLT